MKKMRIIIPFSEDGMKCQTESLVISVHPDKSIAGYQGLRLQNTLFTKFTDFGINKIFYTRYNTWPKTVQYIYLTQTNLIYE